MTVRCTGFMNAMLTCEELFLLLTKDSGKPESRMTYPAYGLTGALLTDLLLAGRISLTEERSPRIYIISSEPTGHPVLDRALEILPAKDGKRFSSLVCWSKLNPTRHIAESLAAAGVVRIHTGGLFGSLHPSYPTLDPVPERHLRARIDATLRREKRFIADAAHELRTPMTALTLQAERLAPYTNDPAARAQLDTLRTGIRRTAALLEQLLLLARSQHTEAAAPATSRVQDTYRQIIETLLPLADRKRSDLGIATDADATLPVPAAELYTLGKNLADNALRYSPPGSRIDLDLETSADAITLIVEDNGPGIAADERARVLDPFYRQLGSEEEGTGLGLAIVKSLCDKHGATLSLHDAKNHAHGLRVEIRFPR